MSGDTVLVELSGVGRSNWVARLDGHEVTHSFRISEITNRPVALLTGLRHGKNTLEVRVGGRIGCRLELRNHPLTGPIFSGPHQSPFVCQTEASGLGQALDAHCGAPTLVTYFYKSTSRVDEVPTVSGLDRGFKPYNPEAAVPDDVAQTVTTEGRTARYVVRREIGTLNRGIYDIQFLHEPGEPLPSPWKRSQGAWNGRLVYAFTGGCNAGYRQGRLGSAGLDSSIARGYAVATSTLNVFANNCNDRLSAETVSMVKEHFIEQFGTPVQTIGRGGSGGGVQQYLIAQNYPGLLDGIVALRAPPDITSLAQSVMDCMVLERAFERSNIPWTDSQKTAVSGFATWRTCTSGWSSVRFLHAQSCHASIPRALTYDAATNPSGVRCTVYDNEVHAFGRDPSSGRARRPLDNTGVQYGLVAFNDGRISAEQFVELNARVGGLDEDGNFSTSRSEAAAESVRLAYERGLVMTGGGGLSEVPIIDWREYTDDLGDAHDLVRSLAVRARLKASPGGASQHIMIVDPRPDFMAMAFQKQEARVDARAGELIELMDRWLENIGRSKPAGLADSCIATDGEKITGPIDSHTSGRCRDLYPPHATPRIAAGAPASDDVLKCVLKPVVASDYRVPMTPEQLKRLETVFPSGVCDYSRPGVGQQITRAVWQSFGR